jgi:hypothetical protein
VVLLAAAALLMGAVAPRALAATGHITGTVRNASAVPVQSVTVTAWTARGSGWDYVTVDSTDGGGSYDLSGLDTGTYRVEFSHDLGTYIDQWYAGKPTVETATDIAVVDGVTTSGVNATLATAGHITGTVRNTVGTGLVGIHVKAFRRVGSLWLQERTGTTVAGGAYDVGGLPAGTYRVSFVDYNEVYVGGYYNGAELSDDATTIAVTAGAATPGINATLAAAGHVTGTVKDAGGGALRGITVTAYRWHDDYWGFYTSVRVSGAAGTYDLGGLPAGTYRVGFSDVEGTYAAEYYDDKLSVDLAADVSVTAGATTPGINATLAAAGHIAGTVKNTAGAALTGIYAEAYRDDGAGWQYVDGVQTLSAGTYDLGGLPAGTYRVGFWDDRGSYAWQFYVDAWAVVLATDVVVTSGATTGGVDGALAAAGHITGTVKDSTGAGLRRGVVAAYRFDGADWRWAGDTLAGAGGAYDIGGLMAGAYRLKFSDRSGACLPQWYGNKASVESSKDVTVTAGATTGGRNATLAAALPRLAKPSCPGSARHGARFKVTGALKPHYTAGAKTVTVKAYRKSGSKWKLLKSFKAVAADYRSYSRYSATVTLSRTGQYRFKASTRATAQIPASTTGFSKTMRIK